jgi:NADPH-dependent curcumin reductase CurA
MPGLTAYAGLTLIGRPTSGETVVVAATSDPVGSLVGQLAKMAGARAVGIAGGPDKCRYVKDEVGFDVAIDHRTPDLNEKLFFCRPAEDQDSPFETITGMDFLRAGNS